MANGILKVGEITTSSGSGTITLGKSGETITSSAAMGSGMGKVLQIQNFFDQEDSQFVTTSTSYVTWTDAPQITITPSSTSSKILVMAYIGMQYDDTGQIENTLYRSIGGGAGTDLSGGNNYGLIFHGTADPGGLWKGTNVFYVDTTHNTTSPINYRWYARSENSASVRPTHGGASNSMLAMEIAG